MGLRSKAIFIPVGLLVLALVVDTVSSCGGGSSSPSTAEPNGVDLVSGGSTGASLSTATPDALSVYAAAIRHDAQVLHGLITQFNKDLDAGGLPGDDAFAVSQAASVAQQLPPPRGSDAIFVPITQSLDAIIKSANAALSAAQDGPGSATTSTMLSARAGLANDLATLDALLAKLPAAPPSSEGTLSQQMEKSIRDNRYAAGNYNFDQLQVAFERGSGVLTVSVNPNDEPADTILLTDASELTIIAGTAIWSTYSQVQAITVVVFQPKHVGAVVSDTYTRPRGTALSYLHLKSQPADDNKVMLCGADHFSVATYIWAQLDDKGCMTAPTK